MDEQTILKALALGEDVDWEFKSAKGGLPGSLWDTYSAMANTEGGYIVLGIEQADRQFTVSGLGDAAKMQQDFWNNINNRNKVSVNLLSDDQVEVKELEGKQVLAIHVPKAGRRQRPIYIGQNPLTGTFRRNYEGDYRCNESEVGRMLSDRSDEPADSFILENFGLKDLDEASIQQYRQRFSARSPDHPWLSEDTQNFLEKLGGWRRDRNSGREGITVAGLLMFGKVEAIRDPAAVPEYSVDYRERLSDAPEVRWTDRLTIDGMWTANVFQFFQRVIQRLTSDLRVPFKLEPNLLRKDETPVHEAIREGLVNALVHADYRGQGGIIIEEYKDRFEMSNPGTLLISFEQLLRGGVSECRNKSMQQMFMMIGGGEKAGSGIDKIRQGWNSQKWRSPSIQEHYRPDRVRLILPMVSLLPQDSMDKLRKRFGAAFDALGPLEVQALVTVDVEGQVTNARLREICNAHPTDITTVLQGLAATGLLLQDRKGRWTSYRLPPEVFPAKSEQDSVHSEATPHISSLQKPVSSLHSLAEEEKKWLSVTAAPAANSSRLKPSETRKIILALCQQSFLTAFELGRLMKRNPSGLRLRFLSPMVSEGLLERKYPDDPNRPDQAYGTKAAQGKP